VAECFACDVNAGRQPAPGGPIHRDDLWLADHGIDRLVRGYVVLKPLRHVDELADLLPQEASTLGTVMRRVLAAMRDALVPERIYVCSFAETVRHLHFHLLPRYADMPGLGPDLVSDLFGGRWSCTLQEAEDAADRIRTALASSNHSFSA
jgi:diadenosine tetraphosphate (Ap4A) HIT family hydrolase